MSEDCSYLNVWTPAKRNTKNLPVPVYFYGGGNVAGDASEPRYDGESMAKKGIVVITFNYRLNIFGFFAHPELSKEAAYKASGNYGLLDHVAALQWVKDNIANFGGDAGNVTVFGQSGGGAKVNTLMAMPSAKGLFHKAINMSGSFRTSMLDKKSTQEIAAEVLKELKIEANNIDEIQKIPFQTLSDAGKKALKTIADRMKADGKPVIGFVLSRGPSNDGEDLPYQLFSNEAFELSKNIPLLIGTTKNEFTPFANGALSNAPLDKVMETVRNQKKEKADAYIAAVKKAYPNDTKPSDLLDIDVTFRPGAVHQANEKSALNAAPVYMYLFTWQSPVMDGKYKAIHCMDIPFAFSNIERCKEMTGGNKDAYVLSDKISSAYINFARNGNPNHKGLPDWKAYNAANTATMHFNNKCEVKPQLDKDLFALAVQ